MKNYSQRYSDLCQEVIDEIVKFGNVKLNEDEDFYTLYELPRTSWVSKHSDYISLAITELVSNVEIPYVETVSLNDAEETMPLRLEELEINELISLLEYLQCMHSETIKN